MVRPFAFHPAVPFAEQDFQTFATRAGFSTDGLDQEQLAYCSKATFQLVKAEKFSKAAVASSAFTAFTFYNAPSGVVAAMVISCTLRSFSTSVQGERGS